MSTEHGPHTTTCRPPTPYVTSPAWSGRPLDDTTWQNSSSCAGSDPEIFHPEMEEGHGTSVMAAVTQAKKVCHACPVKAPCLVYALERDERFGVWGALGRTERRRITKGFPADTPAQAAA